MVPNLSELNPTYIRLSLEFEVFHHLRLCPHLKKIVWSICATGKCFIIRDDGQDMARKEISKVR